MSVIKAKRKQSQFEVLHHWYSVRREITSLMLYDFGYKPKQQEQKLLRHLGLNNLERLEGDAFEAYKRFRARDNAFSTWFLNDARQTVIGCMHNVTEEIFVANSIYPTCMEELVERRLHQDRAVGQCYRLVQELQYVIETLSVDINRYTRLADMVQEEINLIKGWRKSDNKFRRAVSDSASNFANVNNNGNANYNNASASLGVRPDFGSAVESAT